MGEPGAMGHFCNKHAAFAGIATDQEISNCDYFALMAAVTIVAAGTSAESSFLSARPDSLDTANMVLDQWCPENGHARRPPGKIGDFCPIRYCGEEPVDIYPQYGTFAAPKRIASLPSAQFIRESLEWSLLRELAALVTAVVVPENDAMIGGRAPRRSSRGRGGAGCAPRPAREQGRTSRPLRKDQSSSPLVERGR